MDMDREDIINGMFNLIMDRPCDDMLDALEKEAERAHKVRKREAHAFTMAELGLEEEV